jgi:succinate dehydrogenase / fumarate reductase iron-sulfur subunit
LNQSRLLTLKIQRFHKEKDPASWIQTFELESRKGMNLLEGLLRIQEEQDPSLAFRYSCRGAVCGSCAMRVDGQVVLACRTSVDGLLKKPVLIEPLPFFPVIRDLIVDMSVFFESYRRMKPYLHGIPLSSQFEYRMDEGKRKEIDPYINCILCGICFASCPAFDLDKQFLGPAMLAKAYRFLLDPRDSRTDEIPKTVDGQMGVWGCKTVFNCVKVCPKEVPPTHAIVKMRGRILKNPLLSILTRNRWMG